MTKKYRIMDNIPLPATERGRASAYPWLNMTPGQSFAVAPADVLRIRSAASHRGKRYGETYSVRVDKERGGFRCWRTA